MKKTKRALDLFRGSGGWDVFDQELDIESDGVEWNPDACRTADAAGLPASMCSDVRKYEIDSNHGYEGAKGSPPCQTFTRAGNGSGRRDLACVIAELKTLVARGTIDYSRFSDERTGLVLEPFRIVMDAFFSGDPFQWVVLEQVPAVLPVWEEYAEHMKSFGYSVATGYVNSEQYGVPQARKRAVLAARLGGEAKLPRPTHSRFYPRSPDRLDTGVLPWASMVDALPHIEGLVLRSNYARGSRSATSAAERGRTLRLWNQPSVAITSKRMHWLSRDATPHTPVSEGRMVTLQEMAILQSFPPDFPWRGDVSSIRQQIGNAVPPLMARAILREITS